LAIDELVLSEVEGGRVRRHSGGPPREFNSPPFIYQHHKIFNISHGYSQLFTNHKIIKKRLITTGDIDPDFLSWARFGPQFEEGRKRKRKAEKRCPGPRKEGYEEIISYVRLLKHCQEMLETF
jgi:hypothetical protein